jgi:acyl-CoA ligase (AMP-forming) (exosortase A-associated)
MSGNSGAIPRIESALFDSAQLAADKAAIVDGQRQLGYAQLAREALALGQVIGARGVSPGDRVAVFLDKTSEAVVAHYGIWCAGAVVVPVNEGLRAAQVRHILNDSGAKLLISAPRKLSALGEEAYAGVPVLEVTLFATQGESIAQRTDLPGEREPAIILYTSGSTGLPKGILISHENLIAGARIVSRYLELQHDERILSVLPFSFDYGLNQLLTSVLQGATLYLQRSLLPADVCRALESHEITGLAGVPTLWIQLQQRHSPFSRYQFPHLRYITNSGGVFPPALVKRYREQLPHVRIYLMYGLSEAFRSSYLPPSEVDTRPSSMGKAMPETELLVLDENDKQCGPDEVGQLVHAGPTVSLGYWNRPEATAAVFRPDPRKPKGDESRVVYSGDLVKRDAEGFLYFVGRADQQLKSYGFRISPEEVEEALYRSGLLAEVVVRGVPDEVAGTAIEAHVVPKQPDSFEVPTLLRYCETEMPRYMVPKQVVVHAALPRTSSGKVDRKNVGR